MAKIVIAELEIDIDALLKSTSDLKKEIDKVKNAQKELAASGQSSSAAFVENEAVLKSLNSAYASNVKAITETGKATANQVTQAELLNQALNTEVTSIAEARQQNQLLNKLRNETNATTKEGQAQIAALNKKLDENNDFIKENADAYLKQKINIGNYAESVKEAAQSINPLNGGMSGFISRSQEAGGVMPLLQQGLTGVITGIRGMIGASLAFIATPIGAVIAAIGLVVGILVSVFRNLDPVLDKIEQGFAAVSAVIDTVRQTIVAVVTGAKSLGEAFSGLGGRMSQAANDAAKLKDAQQDLNDAMRSQEVANAKASQQYDELIVKSKNRTLSEEERIAYIQKAQKIEEANFKQNAALAQADLKNAIEAARIKGDLSDQELKNLQKNTMAYGNYLLNTGRITEAELEAIKNAEIGKIKIQDQATKRLEKSQNAEDKLAEKAQERKEKEVADAEKAEEKRRELAQKRIDDLLAKSQQEIELFKAQQGFRAKSNDEQLKLNKQLYDKETADLKLQFEKGKITKLQYETEKLNLTNQFAKANADIIIAQGEREIELIRQNSKLSIDERLTAEMNFALLRKEKGLINEQQYQDEITKLQNDAQKLRDDKKLEDEQKEKERKIIDLENQRANDQLTFQQEVDIQKQQNQIKLEEELKNAEKSGADTTLINKKYTDINKALDKSVEDAKIQGAINTFGMIANLLGEQSAIGKAFALTQTVLSGIQGVQNAYTTAQKSPITLLNPAYPYIQAGLAGAFSAVQAAKIAGAKFEQGGIQEIGGNRHAQGGTKFYGEDGTMFEAERGEGIGVLNRRAFGAFMDFNNSYNGGSSSRGFFQGGGIITQGVRPNNFDISSITEALANVPAPIVAVEEIQTVGNRYVSVKENANF